MKQTSGNEKGIEPKFRADVVKEYRNKHGLTHEDFLSNLIEHQELDTHIDISTFRQYFTGAIQNVPIEILKAIANEMGVTLDYLCYNTDTNSVKQYAQNEMGFIADTADSFIKYKPKRWIFETVKRPPDISKKDYTAIYNLFMNKKIPCNGGKLSVIDVFTANMLNLFISTVAYDKTILETFKDNFTNLSATINSNKTQPIGKTEIDLTFDKIFNSNTIQKEYKKALHELNDSNEKLLKDALKESFDSINPNTTLF